MIPALDINCVTVRRDTQTVLDTVTMQIEGPGLVGIVGPNGGGKSTLLATIAGLLATDAGQVRVLGQPPAQAAARLGYVPQAARFDRCFPISLRGMVETALLGPGLWARGRDMARVTQAMAQTGITHLADRRLSALSGGELQRGLIARALATDPQMLLLDEPTASIDADQAAQLFILFCDLARRMPVLVVSHDLAQIAAHADQVWCVQTRVWRALRHDSASALAAEIFPTPAQCRKQGAA